jgi:hypothetical protein
MRSPGIIEVGSGRNAVKAMSVTLVEDSNPPSSAMFIIFMTIVINIINRDRKKWDEKPRYNEVGSGRSEAQAMLVPAKAGSQQHNPLSPFPLPLSFHFLQTPIYNPHNHGNATQIERQRE